MPTIMGRKLNGHGSVPAAHLFNFFTDDLSRQLGRVGRVFAGLAL
jgi:hypothetical protein